MRHLAIFLCLALCGCLPPVEDVAPVAPVVDSTIDQPNPAIQERLKPVTVALSVNKQDAAELGQFYLAFSDMLKHDTTAIQSTSQIRLANSTGAKVMFGGRLKGKYPGVTQTIDSFLAESISPDDVPLNDELRSKAVDAFKALGWACMEASK